MTTLTLVGMPDKEPRPRKTGVSSIRIPLPPVDNRPPGEGVTQDVTSAGIRKIGALTAASKRIEPSKNPYSGRFGAQQASWQNEAWAIYDQVGELRFAANLYANGLSRLILDPCRRAENGNPPIRLSTLEPGKLTETDKLVQQVLADFTSEMSLNEMCRLWGLNKFVVGEAVMVGIPARGRKGRRKLLDYEWKLYSKTDIQHRPGGVLLICGEEHDENNVLLFRIWQPHPRLAREADSPVRATLPILRELIGLTMHVSALIDSRLAGAGILLLPTSATVLGGTAPEDDTEEDPTVAALIESMVTPIKDRDSAASVVPLILTAPDESVDAIRHITFASPLEAAAKELRDEAIRRLALGLDMPPETLLGLGTSSHWNAWAVQEDTVRLHLVPGVKLFGDALIKEFLHPVLEELGVSEEEVNRYSFEIVTDNLIARPNHFDEALELFKVDAITMEALVGAAGFDISDMPEQKQDFDRAIFVALKAVAINPSLFQDPGLPNLVGQLREVYAGKDSRDADPLVMPPRAETVSETEPGPKESNTPDADRPNQAGPPKSSAAGPDKS